ERHKRSAGARAILPGARLDDGKIARSNRNDLRAEPRGFEGAGMGTGALRDEDRRALPQLPRDGGERGLRAAFRRACIDGLVRAVEDEMHEARLRAAGEEIVPHDQDALML